MTDFQPAIHSWSLQENANEGEPVDFLRQHVEMYLQTRQRFHARLGLMFSFKLWAQPLQMNSGATTHAAQLSLTGLNSERIEQTVLGSKNEELFQKS